MPRVTTGSPGALKKSNDVSRLRSTTYRSGLTDDLLETIPREHHRVAVDDFWRRQASGRGRRPEERRAFGEETLGLRQASLGKGAADPICRS